MNAADDARAAQRMRLGIDVGGTFTDFVVLDEASKELRFLKTPSRPKEPAAAVLEGLATLIRSNDLRPADLSSFVHGTTLAVNTLLQRSGASTGLLVTAGFRDLLEIGRLRLPDPTNYLVEQVVPLIARRNVLEVSERMLANGEVLTRLDPDEVVSLAGRLVGAGVEALAICFMHSYKNPVHEKAAAALVRERFPRVFVSASHEIWPQQGEYERCLLTAMNAYVGRKMTTYFTDLEADVRGLGVSATVFSTKSNGGIMTARSAGAAPVETMLSGPASGVMGAIDAARQSGLERIITLDIGGTSVDVSVAEGKPSFATEAEVAGFPGVVMPAIDITSIGSGGGSVAWRDNGGVLKVGPLSAGADPGPACYGRGGTQPTVTDAYVCLGIIAPERFLGGTFALSPELAAEALRILGEPFRLTTVETASAIVEVATANMYSQLLPLFARKGIDYRDFAMVAYGGAGPTHAFLLADEVGIDTVLVPSSPGTLAALGCLVMDVRSDFVHSLGRGLAEVDLADLEQAFQALDDRARTWLASQRIHTIGEEIIRSADMRYRGQSFEINVPMPGTIDQASTIQALFDQAYRRVYGMADPAGLVELVTLRVTIVGRHPKPDLSAATTRRQPKPAQASGTRKVYFKNAWSEAAVLQRSSLSPGDYFDGPAIVEQYDTTVFVTPAFRVSVDDRRNLVAVRGVNHA